MADFLTGMDSGLSSKVMDIIRVSTQLSDNVTGLEKELAEGAPPVGLLVEREVLYRDNRRLTRLLQLAQLKQRNACVEDIDYRARRGLDRSAQGLGRRPLCGLRAPLAARAAQGAPGTTASIRYSSECRWQCCTEVDCAANLSFTNMYSKQCQYYFHLR